MARTISAFRKRGINAVRDIYCALKKTGQTRLDIASRAIIRSIDAEMGNGDIGKEVYDLYSRSELRSYRPA